jgi:hypothetical protein
MNSPVPSNPNRKISVPRDPDVDSAERSREEVMPSPDTTNLRDEDYPPDDKPLPAESPAARQLHDHPPRARGELETGSGGDAARPGKTGIMNTTLPPRGEAR